MGSVEREMLAYLERRLGEGAICVPESEILSAVVPPERPEDRFRPAYRYGLERLLRRRLINGLTNTSGERHYFIGQYPTEEMYRFCDR